MQSYKLNVDWENNLEKYTFELQQHMKKRYFRSALIEKKLGFFIELLQCDICLNFTQHCSKTKRR